MKPVYKESFEDYKNLSELIYTIHSSAVAFEAFLEFFEGTSMFEIG
jgi:hypothetical protein